MSNFIVSYISDDKISFNGEILEIYSHEDFAWSRLVFMTDQYVIKCDNWVEGSEEGLSKQCEREYKKYIQVKNTNVKLKECFVPILDFGELFDGYYYVVQPRVKIEKDVNHKFRTKISKIEEEFNLRDLHNENYTIFNDDILIFDYSH